MKPTSNDVINYAKKFVRKASYGSPNQFTRWYYGNNTAAPWCAIFVYFCLSQTGGKELMTGCANKAYVPTIWNWGKAKGYTRGGTSQAYLGDLVIFDWQKDGVADHIGFVIKDNGNGYVTTVEGNTSNTNNGNGGCVQIRTRSKSLIKGYVRLPYNKANGVIGRGIMKSNMPVRGSHDLRKPVRRIIRRGEKVACYKTYKDIYGRVYWALNKSQTEWVVYSDKTKTYIERTS